MRKKSLKKPLKKPMKKPTQREVIDKYITKNEFKSFTKKEELVNNLLNVYKKNSAFLNPGNHDKMNASNYIYWITNDLCFFDNNKNNSEYIKTIDGPSYNVSVEHLNSNKNNVVGKTVKHVHNLLLNMGDKELLCLLGYKSQYLIELYMNSGEK